MEKPTLYRRRFIPDECIRLDQDYIHMIDETHMITSWRCIKPKNDRAYGSSLFLFKEGLKISKFYDHENNLICWYCDIITFEKEEATNSLYTIDLLADVIYYPDGSFKVVDLDELADAKEKKLISEEYLLASLRQLDFLLRTIHDGKFMDLQSPLDSIPKPWEVLS